MAAYSCVHSTYSISTSSTILYIMMTMNVPPQRTSTTKKFQHQILPILIFFAVFVVFQEVQFIALDQEIAIKKKTSLVDATIPSSPPPSQETVKEEIVVVAEQEPDERRSAEKNKLDYHAPPALTREEIRQLVSTELQKWRPRRWEDDVSRNTLDVKPFTVLPPINERDFATFQKDFRQVSNLKDRLSNDELKAYIARDPYPIPLPEDREGYSPGHDEVYWMMGLMDYLRITDATKRHNVTVESMYDFGCASGRVIRHFYAHTTTVKEIWGSDINQRHIRWLTEFMPADRLKPIFNSCFPSLPMADNSVDLITAFSVFTHIDTFETQWLAELARISHPNGILYLTVHNEDTWMRLREDAKDPQQVEKNRQIKDLITSDPDVLSKLKDPIPEGMTIFRNTDLGPYRGQVFHSNSYLQKVWGRYFEILEFLPNHHAKQTVLVLRKRT